MARFSSKKEESDAEKEADAERTRILRAMVFNGTTIISSETIVDPPPDTLPSIN